MMTQRETALEILYKSIKEESYSNLLMRKELEKLPQIQRAFVTNLVNGILRKYEFLSYQFQDEIRADTSLRIRIILCMALYERFYLKEKDYVVNNEYVELGRNRHEKAFINALLHKIKNPKEAEEPWIRNNLPEWIYRLLSSQYDEETLNSIFRIYQKIPSVCYRINRNRCRMEDLEGLNIAAVDDDIFTAEENLLTTKEYKQGDFYIQDFNSASLYRHLDLQEDHTLLDVCSAPGSKLFNCLDILKPENCYANDLHENRVKLIQKMAEKLGYNGIHYLNEDGRKLKDVIDFKFDRIMLDAPCSGLGVIGRKPDLKFHVRPESLDELEKLQLELLNGIKELVKTEGIILYSTCTLNRKENDRLVRKFLKEEERYELLEEDTIINDQGDAFYYAKIKRVKE
ncbi:MAG: hypothetical protein J5365_09005 [Erysipelotrichaceae bacterium]|nr:hypothetical protein [Erysipelotrichaceae bacterium]